MSELCGFYVCPVSNPKVKIPVVDTESENKRWVKNCGALRELKSAWPAETANVKHVGARFWLATYR